MSAAWMVLNSSSATPAPSTLMRWGWKSASGAPNLSPPTLTCRPSGSYTAERNQIRKISTSWCYTVPALVFHTVLHSGSDIMYSRCIYTTTKCFIWMLRLSNIWVEVFCMGFTDTKSGRHQSLIFQILQMTISEQFDVWGYTPIHFLADSATRDESHCFPC